MSKGKMRLKKIYNAIEDIEFIVNSKDIKVTKALNNKLIKPAIRMNIIRIAEQFNKLKNENEFEILEYFNKRDLQGINAVRNYIAHDYDSTDDSIIEDVVRYNLPDLKKLLKKLINI
jgi:uncharacterized protein with HEPN domain